MKDITHVRCLLEAAARIAQRIETGQYKPDRIDSVTWRTADALLYMRRYVEDRWPHDTSPGIHEKTGMGAMLSRDSTMEGPEEEGAS